MKRTVRILAFVVTAIIAAPLYAQAQGAGLSKGEAVKLTIGQYDADNEAFPISIGVAPWNSFLLPVPIAEAEAFKTAFDNIREEAAKGAQLGIRYDAPSIESITFKMPDGKEYYYGEK